MENSPLPIITTDKPIMTIEYDEPDKLMGANGIFSICIYTNAFGLNTEYIDPFSLTVESLKKNPLIYFVGAMSYIQMINDNPDTWKNWKVVIHTDEDTIRYSPKAFEEFKKYGAIIGTTTLNIDNPNKYRAIFRINRFYPLFIKGLNCPVFVRDADTIFEYEMARLITDGKKDVSIYNYILPIFIKNLHNWEKQYYNKIKDYDNKLVFSFDDEYYFDLQNNNINSTKGTLKNHSKKLTGNELFNSKIHNKKVRFLAGILSKIGENLPENLWYPGLNIFLQEFLYKIKTIPSYPKSNNGHHKLTFNSKINWTDEVYLTEVIYEWCKEQKRAKFFKMRYVSPTKIHEMALTYLKDKYKNEMVNDITGSTIKIIPDITNSSGTINPVYIRANMLRNTSKIPHNIKAKQKFFNDNKGLVSKYFRTSGAYKNAIYKNTDAHKNATKLYFSYPELFLTNKVFRGPFNNNPDTKLTITPYIWGGKKTRRHKAVNIHKRKTIKK